MFSSRRLKPSIYYPVILSIVSLTTTEKNISYNDPVGNTKDLKIYTEKEVSTHTTKETGVWVIFDNYIYDITKFIPNHPGGPDKIKLASGKNVEPYWSIYPQHYNSKLPKELLEKMKIGRLHEDDILRNESKNNELKKNDPYSSDPLISPLLNVHSAKPINAEAPGVLLTDNWITPDDTWFVRNHHPVPINIDENNYKITLSGNGIKAPIELTLNDLKTKYKPTKIVSTLQCGGNRRGEMNKFGVTSGTAWDISAISTAEWTGVRLYDIMKSIGISYDEDFLEENNITDVQFIASEGMEASVSSKKALSKNGDVILAYEMNGKPIPNSHGYPLRAIVPGHVGVRNVKWLSQIVLSNEESKGPWQRSMAYKGFGPSIKSIDSIDVEKIPSLQEQPVQSAITYPSKNHKLIKNNNEKIVGYAYSGGGRGIIRVDVSIDGGNNWVTAKLKEGSEQPLDKAWAWTFWEANIKIPDNIDSAEIICKATDASYNVQPDSVKGIWNLRGINNNAWHRVNVNVTVEDEEEAANDDEEDE